MSETEQNAARAARIEAQTGAQTLGPGQTRNTGGLPGLGMSGPGLGPQGRQSRAQTPQQPDPNTPRIPPAGAASALPRTLWFINDQGKLDLILVRTGISDGSFTEIHEFKGRNDEKLEGMQVILRERVG